MITNEFTNTIVSMKALEDFGDFDLSYKYAGFNELILKLVNEKHSLVAGSEDIIQHLSKFPYFTCTENKETYQCTDVTFDVDAYIHSEGFQKHVDKEISIVKSSIQEYESRLSDLKKMKSAPDSTLDSEDGWIKTDDLQWLRKDNDTNFEVINVYEFPTDDDEEELFVVSTHNVDLNDYSEEDLLDEIRPFGYESLKDVSDIYGIAANQIIAECISENEAVNGGGNKMTKTELQEYLYRFFKIVADI